MRVIDGMKGGRLKELLYSHSEKFLEEPTEESELSHLDVMPAATLSSALHGLLIGACAGMALRLCATAWPKLRALPCRACTAAKAARVLHRLSSVTV